MTRATAMLDAVVAFIRETYGQPEGVIPLHAPRFAGKEREYVLDAIDSTFVSSVGAYVDRFEGMLGGFTGTRYAIATSTGTAALHTALVLAGAGKDALVLTQPLSFVATANAVAYTGAEPVFLDVDQDSLSLSPEALKRFLDERADSDGGICYDRRTGRRISACVPMHTFGFPCRADALATICAQYGIALVEDAAESLGSLWRGKHTGAFGLLGIFSFNGNKTVTAGGGGAIITGDENLARRAKHLTTTAKLPHPWEYRHDAAGFNYRMPNINAALACAQLEQLGGFIARKRELAKRYAAFFQAHGVTFIHELEGARANCWLNTICWDDHEERDGFLEYTNSRGVMTRPAWQMLNTLPMYRDCETDGLPNATWLSERLVNLPSSVPPQ